MPPRPPMAAARNSRPAPGRRRRTDRTLLCRDRRQGTQRDSPRAYGQRPARPGGPDGRRCDGVQIRHHRPPDQAHLGSAQPREAPALDNRLHAPRTAGSEIRLCHADNASSPRQVTVPPWSNRLTWTSCWPGRRGVRGLRLRFRTFAARRVRRPLASSVHAVSPEGLAEGWTAHGRTT